MALTTSANGLSVVHKSNKGKAMSTIPNVCCIPSSTGKIPIPFMNKAESKKLSGGTITVQVDGASVAVLGSMISKSSGDSGGVLGGVISGSKEGKALFISFSPDVFFEKRPVCRKTDKLLMNDINTICLGGWDQEDVEEPEAKEWVKLKIIDDDESDDPQTPIKGVKVKATLPDGSSQSVESGVNGNIRFYDIDPGSCSIALDEPEDSSFLEITQRWPSSGLATKAQHKIGVKVEKLGGATL